MQFDEEQGLHSKDLIAKEVVYAGKLSGVGGSEAGRGSRWLRFDSCERTVDRLTLDKDRETIRAR